MTNILGKLAKKIGILNLGGTINIRNFRIENDQEKRPENERKLIKQIKREVYGRLRDSLHSQFVNLHKESQPYLVSRFWDADIKIGLKGSDILPEETTILDLFNREDIGGRLLILGQPGSGKTTTQLELARRLIENHVNIDPNYPIPILINLSSWVKKDLYEWLVETIRFRYHFEDKIITNWLDQGRLLLLLDGLDELRIDLQESCIEAINQFIDKNQSDYVVICSREEEYKLSKKKLHLNGVIQLKNLTEEQIKGCLYEIGKQDLWLMVSQDPQLLDLVKTPLILSITILTYQDMPSKAGIHAQSNAEDRIRDLWESYIQRMLRQDLGIRICKIYQNQGQAPSLRQTYRWLIWLAQRLEENYKSEFYIESLQPTYLTHQEKINYISLLVLIINAPILLMLFLFLGAFLSVCISGGIIFTIKLSNSLLLLNFNVPDLYGLWGGFIIGFWLAFVTTESLIMNEMTLFKVWSKKRILRVKNIEFLKWSNNEFFRSIYQILSSYKPMQGSKPYLPAFIALTGGFIRGWIPEYAIDINVYERPNHLIYRAIINCFKISVSASLIFALLVTFPFLLLHKSSFPLGTGYWYLPSAPSIAKLVSWLVFTVILAAFIVPITVVYNESGLTFLQHLVIRWLLYRNNYAPWNYAQFLDYCKEKLILERVGGRYRFIHKQLQEHFASMSLNSQPVIDKKIQS